MAEAQADPSLHGRTPVDADAPAHERMIRSVESSFSHDVGEGLKQLSLLEHSVAGSVFKADLGRINADLRQSGLLRGHNGDMEIVGDHGAFKLGPAGATAGGEVVDNLRRSGEGFTTTAQTGHRVGAGNDIDSLFESAGPGSLRSKPATPAGHDEPMKTPPPKLPELNSKIGIDPAPESDQLLRPDRFRSGPTSPEDPLALPKGWAPRVVRPSPPRVPTDAPAEPNPNGPEPQPVIVAPQEKQTPAPIIVAPPPVELAPPPVQRDHERPPVDPREVTPPTPAVRDGGDQQQQPRELLPLGNPLFGPLNLDPGSPLQRYEQTPHFGRKGPPPTWPPAFPGNMFPGPSPQSPGRIQPPGPSQGNPLWKVPPPDRMFPGLTPGWSQPQGDHKGPPPIDRGSTVIPPARPPELAPPPAVQRPEPPLRQPDRIAPPEAPPAPPLGQPPSNWRPGVIDQTEVKEVHLSVFATGFTRHEGGPNDRWLRKNYTLQNYVEYQKRLARGETVPKDQQVPYISLAMDDQNGIQDGQLVRIPSLEKMYNMPLKFRVTDTGSAFTNRNFDKVDVNVDTVSQAGDITTHRDVYFLKEAGDQQRQDDLQFAKDHRVQTAPPPRRRHPAHGRHR